MPSDGEFGGGPPGQRDVDVGERRVVPAREWFTPAFAERRNRLGRPADRTFQRKPALGLDWLCAAKGKGLTFDLIACDDAYGRGQAFRAAINMRRKGPATPASM
jgi:hypothetical protein